MSFAIYHDMQSRVFMSVPSPYSFTSLQRQRQRKVTPWIPISPFSFSLFALKSHHLNNKMMRWNVCFSDHHHHPASVNVSMMRDAIESHLKFLPACNWKRLFSFPLSCHVCSTSTKVSSHSIWIWISPFFSPQSYAVGACFFSSVTRPTTLHSDLLCVFTTNEDATFMEWPRSRLSISKGGFYFLFFSLRCDHADEKMMRHLTKCHSQSSIKCNWEWSCFEFPPNLSPCTMIRGKSRRIKRASLMSWGRSYPRYQLGSTYLGWFSFFLFCSEVTALPGDAQHHAGHEMMRKLHSKWYLSKVSSWLFCLVGDAQGHHAPLEMPVYVMIANVTATPRRWCAIL